MNIYIKSFNRPFYLDRCIRSIKFNVSNYSNIIVLDDGTLGKYIEKLKQSHPDVRWIFSNADDNKFELLRQEKFDEIKKRYIEPAKFWVTEIQKEKDDYFLMLEDDTWIVKSFCLNTIEKNLIKNECIFLKFWWPIGDEKLIVTQKYNLPDDIKSIDYYKAGITTMNDIYKIWIVAFAVFRKDYWLNNFKKVQRMGDEQTQLIEAYNFVKDKINITFSKSSHKWVYQGWVIPGRATPEYYDKGLIQHLYMHALNEAWYNNEMDVTQGYPYDFDDDYISKVLQKYLPQQSIDVWKKWKSTDTIYAY